MRSTASHKIRLGGVDTVLFWVNIIANSERRVGNME